MKPRRRYFSTVLTGFALLVVLGGGAHWSANRSQRRSLERRIDALQSDFASLQTRCAAREMVAVSNERSESVAGKEQRSVLVPPRILGRGRTGRYIYCDVRYSDGYTARYYIASNSTPQQVRSYVYNLASDAREHSLNANSVSELQ